MTPPKNLLLSTVRTGMELSWLYALIDFFTMATMQRSFPLPRSVAVFLLAGLSVRTGWLPSRIWRFVFLVVYQGLGFALAAALILYDFTDGGYPFLGTRWPAIFFSQSRTPAGWIILGLLVLSILAIWIVGITHGRRPQSYTSVCGRFDVGVTAFFLLFIFKLLLFYRGQIRVDHPSGELLMFAFFIFGFMALGLVDRQGAARQTFLSGFRGLGLLVGLILVGLGLSAAVFLLCLPHLIAGADIGYGALKSTTAPLGPVIITILRFVFGHRRAISDGGSSSSNAEESLSVGDAGPLSFWEQFFISALAVLVGLALVVLLGVCLWALAQWLRRQFAQSQQTESLWSVLRRGWRRLWARWLALGKKLITRLKGYATAAQLFAALVRWGRYSGIAHHVYETPLEYGTRLTQIFPVLRDEIITIIDAYHSEIYRSVSLDPESFKTAKSALWRLRSPRYWPGRLKAGLWIAR